MLLLVSQKRQISIEDRAPVNAFNCPPPLGGLCCRPFYGDGSVVVNLLFYLPCVVCGCSVLVFVFGMNR